MRNQKIHSSRSRSADGAGFFVALIAVLVLSVGLLGGIGWWLHTTPPSPTPPPTTTATTATTATATTLSSTTATTITTTASTTTTATAAGERELLQYDPAGHYVQEDATDWRLKLVNDWNPISADYEKGITLVKAGNRGQRADSRILADLNAMLSAGKAHGIDVQSGYRAYEKQQTLYWRKVDSYLKTGLSDTQAQQKAGTIVKRPGYSEHNTGLAVDLGGSGDFSLGKSFESTAAYHWLIENCADYGFILRFPKNKEDITGVIFESWHFRYVGKEAAKIIMDNGWCLEEYLANNPA